MTTSLFWTRSCHLSCQKICTICLKPRMNPLCRWGHPRCRHSTSKQSPGPALECFANVYAETAPINMIVIPCKLPRSRSQQGLVMTCLQSVIFFLFCINSFLNFPKALQSLKKSNNKSCKGTSFVWFSCMLIELHWFRATFVIVGWVKVKKIYTWTWV